MPRAVLRMQPVKRDSKEREQSAFVEPRVVSQLLPQGFGVYGNTYAR